MDWFSAIIWGGIGLSGLIGAAYAGRTIVRSWRRVREMSRVVRREMEKDE